MTQDGNGFSSVAKGFFLGSALGAAVAMLYALRSGAGSRSGVSDENGGFQLRYGPYSATRVGNNVEAEKRMKPPIGWLVVFGLASAVAMISDWRLKKLQQDSHG